MKGVNRQLKAAMAEAENVIAEREKIRNAIKKAETDGPNSRPPLPRQSLNSALKRPPPL